MYRKYLHILFISLQTNIHLVTTVADLGCSSWIQIFHPDPGSKKFRIPDPNLDPHQRKMIRDVHPGFGS